MTAVAPTRLSSALSTWGFDVARLPFTLRTALGACAALLIGWCIGLDHPQWSAMTVWAASQPMRGQVIEKSLFRMAGTVGGVAAGVAFLLISGSDPLILVLAVSAWTALCAAAGNLQRGYVAYGVTLAGYSAAMVALLDYNRPSHILELAGDRLATVLLGIVVAMVIGLAFAPRRSEGVLAARTRNLTARLLRAMARDLRDEPADDRAVQPLLAEAALIEETLDSQAAGSWRSRQEARGLRRILVAQVSAVVWLLRPATPASDAASTAVISEALDQAAVAFETALLPADLVGSLERAADAAAGNPALHEALLGLETAVRDRLLGDRAATERPQRVVTGLLHRDWVGAREAGLRSLAVMLLMGAVWVVTGWSTGPYLMLGAAVMTSVFSSMDFPARTIVYVFRGVVLGVLAALICRWLVWPLARQPIELVLLTMPFLLLGPFLMSHRRTGEGAFDYNMNLLLLLPPIFPLTGSLSHSLAIALAVLAGPAAAWLGYRLIYPATLSRRLDTLIGVMVSEVQAMARSPDAVRRQDTWRARLQHRMLRLSRWVDKTGDREVSAVAGGLAVLTLGQATIRLHALSERPVLANHPVSDARIALEQIRGLNVDPDSVVAALRRVADHLPPTQVEDVRLLRDAADAVAAHPAFFLRSTKAP
ncbi:MULTISPECIES: FUSC family protein [unclassified Brevundimonas]|uniref:FUSC family protein n=1 Tax=unclassified Brevundimonas TaxID=2622653 RepID=UPI003F938F95